MTTRYIVVRPGPDLPPGFLPDRWDGRWLDRDLPLPPALAEDRDWMTGAARATGRYETRDDGERAEVYEVALDRVVQEAIRRTDLEGSM